MSYDNPFENNYNSTPREKTYDLLIKYKPSKGILEMYNSEKSGATEAEKESMPSWLPYNGKDIMICGISQKIVGWSQQFNKPILSNNTNKIWEEELDVHCYVDDKKKEIANGLWKDIKFTVKGNGGKLCFELAALDSEGRRLKIEFEGTAYNAFLGVLNKKLQGVASDSFINTIEFKFNVEAGEEGNAGGNKYFVPKFTQGSPITTEDRTKAIDYFNVLNGRSEEVEEPIANTPVTTETINLEDIPF